MQKKKSWMLQRGQCVNLQWTLTISRLLHFNIWRKNERKTSIKYTVNIDILNLEWVASTQNKENSNVDLDNTK